MIYHRLVMSQTLFSKLKPCKLSRQFTNMVKYKKNTPRIIFAIGLLGFQSSYMYFNHTQLDAGFVVNKAPIPLSIGTVIPASNSLTEVVYKYLQQLLQTILSYFSAVNRVIYCTGLVIPALLLGPLAVQLNQGEVLWSYIAWTIEKLGPTFIKLAQWASTRPDLFPEDLVIHLQRFQNSTKTHPWSTASQTLTNAFGPNWNERIKLNPEPIGSGCIAQVYQGTLLPVDGSKPVEIAVKLIHPYVEHRVEEDMAILNFVATVIEMIPRLEYLSLKDTVSQFAESMQQQLDLTKEAFNMKRFQHNFKDVKYIEFPTPIEGYIRKNVLIETFMPGTPIMEFMSPDVDTKLKNLIADLCARAMLRMVFKDNFVHGDLHPGNVMVRLTEQGPKIVVLDCGIVTEVCERNHAAMVDISLAFLQWDGYKAGMLLLDRAAKQLCGSTEAFASGVQQIVDDAKSHRYFEHVGEYIARVCHLSCAHRVKVVADYLQVALAVKVVEGISLALDPDMDLTSKAIPIVLSAQAQYIMDMALGKNKKK